MAAEYTDKLKKKLREMSARDLFAIAVDASALLFSKHVSETGYIDIHTRSRDDRLNVDIKVDINPNFKENDK